MAKLPRERTGQYVSNSGASQRVKEAMTVRKDTMPRKGGKRGC